jgi:hypothetical protein
VLNYIISGFILKFFEGKKRGGGARGHRGLISWLKVFPPIVSIANKLQKKVFFAFYGSKNYYHSLRIILSADQNENPCKQR